MGFVMAIMFPGDHSMEYYTTRQAAEIFGVTPITVRRWIWSGDLIAVNPKGEGGPRQCQQFIITGDSVERLLKQRGAGSSFSRPSGCGSQVSR
ncbi:MAG: helix-turn-helix domain-containing protein [Rhodobacteraceae bacterium]|nr:helix-turn-helix domain-containing protein [Paracoccaceae bacterium]